MREVLENMKTDAACTTASAVVTEGIVISGGNTAQVQNECLQFSPITFFWQDFATTKTGGTDVTGWVNSDGLVLVDSDKAEVVRSQKIFEYRHSGHHEGSCAITGDDFIILTGS